MTSMLFPDLSPSRGAVISPCGLYRYTLLRRWGEGTLVNFVMLNPSTADASEDDPTIRRCVGYAKAWGHDGLIVTNLFALRSTDPKVLRVHSDPIGPENDRYLRSWARSVATVVCAWGNDGRYRGRSAAVRELFRRELIVPSALKITGQGEPSHPLYLPNGLSPKPWSLPT